MMHWRATKWLKQNSIHRRALSVAAQFFEKDGGAAAYILGEPVLIERMVATWQILGAAMELPEYETALTARQFAEIMVKLRG